MNSSICGILSGVFGMVMLIAYLGNGVWGPYAIAALLFALYEISAAIRKASK